MTPQIPLFRSVAVALALVLPVAAMAQQARTTTTVNLRAGPDGGYPLVQRFGPGTPVVVQGCVDGYRWCDVVGPGNERGWLYGGSLQYPYQNANVPLLGYGAAIGIPIVTFAISNYWNDYYRQRSWYGNQRYWHDYRPRPPQYRPPHYHRPPPPRPPVVIVRPPHHSHQGPGAGHPNRPHQQPGARPPNQPRPHQGQRPPNPNRQPSQLSTDRSNAP